MPDMKDMMNDLNKAFTEFRETNDGRLAQLAEDIEDVHNRCDKYELDLQDRGTGGVNLPLGGREGQKDKEYHDAFLNYLVKGTTGIPTQMMNSLSVGSAPDGGFWVPASTSEKIITRLFESSPVRRVANVEAIPNDRWEAPKDTNEATSGGWVGETETRSTTATPEVGLQEIPLHEQYAQPQTTQKMLDMRAHVDVESWLVGKITRKIARDENTAFVSGNGVMKPRGFTDHATAATADASRSWEILEHIVSGASGDFKAGGSGPADCLFDMVFALKSEYTDKAVWGMNKLTLAKIAKFRNNDDIYILDVATGLTQDVRSPFNLLGFPVLLFADMPDYNSANNLAVVFGDFSEGYQVLDHTKGMTILKDPFTTKGWVKFYCQKYCGGDVTNFDALKLLKMST